MTRRAWGATVRHQATGAAEGVLMLEGGQEFGGLWGQGNLCSGPPSIYQMAWEEQPNFLNLSFSIWGENINSSSAIIRLYVSVFGALWRKALSITLYFLISPRDKGFQPQNAPEMAYVLKSLGGLFNFYENFNIPSATFKDLILQRITELWGEKTTLTHWPMQLRGDKL